MNSPRNIQVAVLLQIPLLAFLLLSGQVAAQTSQPFISAESSNGSTAQVSFIFTSEDKHYQITNDGRIRRSGRLITSPQSGRLRLGRPGNIIERVYYVSYLGDLLLLCEDTDGEGAAGFITRLNGKTLTAKWWQQIPGFNVGQGLIFGQHVYVTARGFVGKMNLETGAYVWSHNDLWGKRKPDSFDLPEINGGDVVFYEAREDGGSSSISIERSSGRVVGLAMKFPPRTEQPVKSSQVPIVTELLSVPAPNASNSSHSSKINVTPTPTPIPSTVRYATGTNLIPAQGTNGRGVLRISNGTDSDAIAKLVDNETGKTRRLVYIQSQSGGVISGIEPGDYILKFSLGRGYNESTGRFLNSQSFYRFDEVLDFREYRTEADIKWAEFEVTLNPVIDGNARTTPISAAEFEDK